MSVRPESDRPRKLYRTKRTDSSSLSPIVQKRRQLPKQSAEYDNRVPLESRIAAWYDALAEHTTNRSLFPRYPSYNDLCHLIDVSIPLVISGEPEPDRLRMVLHALEQPARASSTLYFQNTPGQNTLDSFPFKDFARRLSHSEATGLACYWQEVEAVSPTQSTIPYWGNRFLIEHEEGAAPLVALHPEFNLSLVVAADGSTRLFRTTPTIAGLEADQTVAKPLSFANFLNGTAETNDTLMPGFIVNYERVARLIRESLPAGNSLHDIPFRQQFELFRYMDALDIEEGPDTDQFRRIIMEHVQTNTMPSRLNLLSDSELAIHAQIPEGQVPRLRDFIRYHMLFGYMRLYGPTGLSILTAIEATPESFNHILDAGTAYPEFREILVGYARTNTESFEQVQSVLEQLTLNDAYDMLPTTPLELRGPLLQLAHNNHEIRTNYYALRKRTAVLVAAAARLLYSSKTAEERAEYFSLVQDAFEFEQSAFLAKAGFQYKRGATNEDIIRLSRFAFDTTEVRALAEATVSSWLEVGKRRQKHMPYRGRVAEVTDAFYTAFITMQEGNTASETTGDTETEISRYLGSLERDVARGQLEPGTAINPLRFGYIGIDSGQRVERHVVERANALLGEHLEHIGIDIRESPQLIPGVQFFQGQADEVLSLCANAGCSFDRLYAIWSSMPTDLLELDLVERTFGAVGRSLKTGGRLEIDFPFPYGEHSHEKLVQAHRAAHPYDVDAMATVGFKVGSTEVSKPFLMQDPISLVIGIAEKAGLRCTNLEAVQDYAKFVRQVQIDDTFLADQEGITDLHKTPVWQTRAGKNRITLQFEKATK